MTYAATVLADSVAGDVRLTTLEVTMPRFILAEFNTHRMLSRNSASSRAIPVERRIEQVRTNPFVPEAFGVNKGGMQATATLPDAAQVDATETWLRAARQACEAAKTLAHIGVHKQHANRLLEPYAWHTVVVTATELENFFALRCHPAAQPEMQITAKLMREAMGVSTPRALGVGEWHLPYVGRREEAYSMDDFSLGDYELPDAQQLALSVVRCAAVSYERQNAGRTIEQVVTRHDEMVHMGHWSPFEHQARVMSEEAIYDHMGGAVGGSQFVGNFRLPWLQYRKTFDGESVFKGGV